jgi:bifunctional DNA-binding transcriptional regulator/antitoxin component of YhaV-PrlF toxin-antitoxin module
MKKRKKGSKAMLAKMTSKNQITIPKKIVEQIPDTKYFEVELKEGIIVLKPLRTYETDLEKIRSKIKGLGLKPDSVREAVEWARSK